MTPERKAKLIRTLKHRQPDLTLIADKVHKPRNLAALVRTADAAGIHRVHTVAPSEGYQYSGTALGSERWVQTQRHDTFDDAIKTVRAQGMKVFAAHFSDRAVNYTDVDYTQPCAILMGAEKQGVSEGASELADEHIIIPMVGMVSSLNVSTAAGMILAEAMQQRMRAGMYEAPRLPADELERTLFEWVNRDVALFCRAKGLAYPAYDAEGEMVDPQGWNKLVQQGEAPKQRWY